MFRHSGFVVRFVSGCLIGLMWLSSAFGQMELLSPSATLGQPSTHLGTARRDLIDPAVPRQLVGLGVSGDGRLSSEPLSLAGLSSGPAMWCDCYRWHILPDGLMYPSYLAGGREPRFGSEWVHMEGHGWRWDVVLGGRVGLARYGTDDPSYPEGFQVDLEGAVFPRLDLGVGYQRDLVSTDFRVGVPFTARQGPWEGKLAYYHISSHLGDEFIAVFPQATRINYVRDSVVLGVALRPHPDWRLYTEAGWAFNTDGGSEPWEFQFGVDFSPARPSDACGAPFFAVNGYLREEVDFGGGLTVQTGWQWRSWTGHLARLGLHYFNGMSNQRQFFNTHEELIGVGMWYDY